MRVCSGLALLTNKPTKHTVAQCASLPLYRPSLLAEAVAHNAASMLTLPLQRGHDLLASAYSLSLVLRDYVLLPCAC